MKALLKLSNALLIILGKYDNCVIKCSRFKGNTMDVFVDKKEYKYDIFSQIEETENFIKNHIRLRGEIKGLQRTDVYEIPNVAIREALINAVLHRDYVNMGRDVKVGIFDDRLSIVSPGGFPNTITQEDILEGRSEVRNKIIAKILKELNYIEQWGSGIKRIKSSCLGHGLKEPLIIESGDFVKVDIYREMPENAGKMPESAGKMPEIYKNLSEQEKLILSYTEDHGKVTTKEVANILSIKERRSREILKNMVEKNLLEVKGQGRNTHYVVIR